MVQFINMDWAAKFRGSGGQQLDEGCRLEVGEKVIVVEDQSIIDIIDTNIESEDVSEEIVSSVVGLGGEESGSREGAELREDFLVLFDIL